MKSQLLNQAARGKSDLAVLDFGCGFGGDIKKLQNEFGAHVVWALSFNKKY